MPVHSPVLAAAYAIIVTHEGGREGGRGEGGREGGRGKVKREGRVILTFSGKGGAWNLL